jgi:hypothetical protein
MAVGAKDLQVLQAVVVALAVEVMQGERNRTTSPLAHATSLATACLETGVE